MLARLFVSILICVLLLFVPVLAAHISGMITDSDSGDPIAGVHVSIKETNSGAITDIDGKYIIKDIDPGEYDIIFRIIGYSKIQKSIIIDQQKASTLNISMIPIPWQLDEVVVTATRREQKLKDVPVTTELITKEDMTATGALTVAQALESHIGVMIDDDLSGRGVTLRGVDPSRVLILIDGHRIVGRVRGSIDLGQISLSDVEQIEIVKGTGSTLYGSDALGGVINIITKKPEKTRSLRTSIEYGSFNTFDPEFEFQAKENKFGILLSGKHEKTDGFDLDKSTPHTNGLENVKRYNLNSKLTFDPTAAFHHELSLGFMHEQKIWIESEYFEPLLRTFAYDDYEWNDRYDMRYSTKYMFSGKTEAQASIYGSIYDHKWEKYTVADILDDFSKTKDHIIESSFQLNHSFSDNVIATTGTDFSYSGLKSDEIRDGKKNVSFGDAYFQVEWLPRKNLTFMPGIRWEHHQTYGTHINPSMNFKWTPFEMLSLRGTASKGFRAPSIKEIYFIFDHSAAGYIVYGGDEDLKAETSDNFSLTAELNYNRRGIHRLTVFRNNLDNLIEFELIEYTPIYWRGVYRYQNIVEARTEGLEWESDVQICTGWDMSFSYTYLLAKNLTEKVDLINRPQHTFKFRSIFELPIVKTNLTIWGIYHDHKLWTGREQTPDRIGDVYAPKRIVLNSNISRNIYKNLDGYLRVENLANETDALFGYWPARTFTAGIKFKIF